MLILDSRKVSHCRVHSRKNPKGYAGLKYRDLLFVKARPFPSDKRQEAIRLCQETLDAGRFCILLKESDRDRYTLCYQVSAVKTPPKAAAPSPRPAQPRRTQSSGNTILARPAAPPRSRLRGAPDDNRTILQRPKPATPPSDAVLQPRAAV